MNKDEDRTASNGDVQRHLSFDRVAIDQINQDNCESSAPRVRAGVSELKASISTVGIVQPLLLHATDQDSYVVIDGFQRLHAAIELGMTHLPALVLSTEAEMSEQIVADLMFLSVILNRNWSSLHPIELGWGANAFVRSGHYSQRRFAAGLGIHECTVSEWRSLARAIPEDMWRECTGEAAAAMMQMARRRHFRFIGAAEDEKVRRHRLRQLAAAADAGKSLDATMGELTDEPTAKQSGLLTGARRILLVLSWLAAVTARSVSVCGRMGRAMIARAIHWLQRFEHRRRQRKHATTSDLCHRKGVTGRRL
jgi:hypothetical protein